LKEEKEDREDPSSTAARKNLLYEGSLLRGRNLSYIEVLKIYKKEVKSKNQHNSGCLYISMKDDRG